MITTLNESRKITGIREAVGVFHAHDRSQRAIADLLSTGSARAALSLLPTERTVTDTLGHRYERVEELEDDARVPRSAYVSTEAIGDAEGGVIGGLVYVGAIAAAGAILASGGTLAGA